jgi:hypothetical protein
MAPKSPADHRCKTAGLLDVVNLPLLSSTSESAECASCREGGHETIWVGPSCARPAWAAIAVRATVTMGVAIPSLSAALWNEGLTASYKSLTARRPAMIVRAVWPIQNFI